MTVAAFPLAPDDATVSPPREVRLTDITKAAVPMPFMLTVIGAVISMAFFVFSIKSDVSLMEQRQTLQYEELKSRIDAAGLRNANMGLSQELQRAMQEIAALKDQLKARGQ